MYFSDGVKKPQNWKDFGKKKKNLLFSFPCDLCMKLLTEGCPHSSASLSPPDEGHLTIFWGSFLKCPPTFQCVCLGITGTWASTGWSCPATCGTSLTTWTGESSPGRPAGLSCSLPLPGPSHPCPVPASGSQSSPSSVCWHHGPFDLEQILFQCSWKLQSALQQVPFRSAVPNESSSFWIVPLLWGNPRKIELHRASQGSCVLALPPSTPHSTCQVTSLKCQPDKHFP